jgi:cytosol alanyl aminopeptidase
MRIVSSLLLLIAVIRASVATEVIPTGKLPDGVTPKHYSLNLKIDPNATRFSGKARLHILLDRSVDHIWLHAKKINITHAELIDASGKVHKAAFTVDGESDVAKVDFGGAIPAQEIDLVMDYNAPFNAKGEGLYKVKVGTDAYAITQMEAISARYAFPSFDEPRFKTPFDIALTVPVADLAFSNTRTIREQTSGDGKWKTLTFATTKPLPTYLIAFAVGPWDVAPGPTIEPNDIRKTPLALRGIVPSGGAAQLKWILDQTPAIVNYFEQYTAQPFAFDKLDLLGVPSFGASGMENAGLILFDDALLRFDAHSSANAHLYGYETVAHEVSHQWFGDLVTMPWWDDLWLNESFANWAQYKATIALKPEYLGEMDRAVDALSAMGSDSLLSARAIRQPIKSEDDIDNAFDGITYMKGAALLRMIETWIGEDVYRDAMRAYFAQRDYGSGNTDDLIATLAEHSGKGDVLSKTMRSFLDQPGVPLVHSQMTCSDGKATLSLSQSRYLPFGASSKQDSHWVVPVCARFAREKATSAQCFVLSEQRQDFTVDGGCVTWYSLNADANGYYRVAMNDCDAAALGNHYASLDPLDQKYSADSIGSGFRHGDLPPSKLLDAMPLFADSNVPQISTALLEWYKWIRVHLADASTRPILDAYAGRLYLPHLRLLGFHHRDDDTPATSTLRATLASFFADTLRDASVRAELVKQGRNALGLDSHAHVDLSRADPDLRGIALEVTVQDVGTAAFEAALTELKTNRDTQQRSELFNAIGATRDPALGIRARNYALTRSLEIGEMLAIFSAQNTQAENRASFWAWFTKHFEAIRARLPDEDGIIGIVAVERCSDAELKEFAGWFAPRIKQLVGGERVLAQLSENIEQCSALRSHVGTSDLGVWLKAQSPSVPH